MNNHISESIVGMILGFFTIAIAAVLSSSPRLTVKAQGAPTRNSVSVNIEADAAVIAKDMAARITAHPIVPWSNQHFVAKEKADAEALAKKVAAEKLVIAEAARQAKEKLKSDCAAQIESMHVSVQGTRGGTISPWSVGGAPFTNIEAKFDFALATLSWGECVKRFNGFNVPKDWRSLEQTQTIRVYLGDNEKNFILVDRWGRHYTKTANFVGELNRIDLAKTPIKDLPLAVLENSVELDIVLIRISKRVIP